jgi:hypothetical protein
MLGRPPVVVSDQWVAPTGPDWDSFSIRVAESDVASIPAILRERASEAIGMGRAARNAWSAWFSPEASFHRTVEWCLELVAAEPRRHGAKRLRPWGQMARPVHIARSLRYAAGRG